MTHRVRSTSLLGAALLLAAGCSSTPTAPGTTGGAGSGTAGATASAGTTGTTGTAGGSGDAGTTGTAGTTSSAGTTGTAGATASAGATGSAGAGVAGQVGGAGSGGAGAPGTAGAGGAADGPDPVAPRALNVTPSAGCCSIGNLSVKSTAKLQGKLVLVLGGICGGPGGGGIESYASLAGFHIWKPSTQTCVNNAPQKYHDMLADNDPSNDAEANRQVGDARMELWDGVDRVDWVTVAKGQSIVEQTQAALKNGALNNQGGDWGYFLNADGTVRWTDVYVVGYSWGSQTLAMISSYVRFGRVFTTSGPQAEGFPNGTWITHPSATPNDRKYMAVGFNQPYPSMDKVDIAPNTVTSMIETTMKAGWGNGAPPMNVKPGDKGPFTGAHLFAMVGSAPNTPGGHTVFCTDNPTNGWIPLCEYAFGVK